MEPSIRWRNIVLRDVRVVNPATSPGVIIGNATYSMLGIVFDNVTCALTGGSPRAKAPWRAKSFACKGVKGAKAIGWTNPKPPCFD